MKKLGAGETTILFSTTSLPPIIYGIFVFKELLTLKLVVGILLILSAVWVITTEKLSFKSKSGVVFALLAALSSGLATINDVIILKIYNAYSYMAIMSLLPGILLALLFSQRFKTTILNLKNKSVWRLGILSFFYTIQGITYYLAFQTGAPISQLSPILRSSVVLTVILAAVFLNERSNLLRKIFAAGIMFGGVILLG